MKPKVRAWLIIVGLVVASTVVGGVSGIWAERATGVTGIAPIVSMLVGFVLCFFGTVKTLAWYNRRRVYFSPEAIHKLWPEESPYTSFLRGLDKKGDDQKGGLR